MNYIWILLISCYSNFILEIKPTPNLCGKCVLFPIVKEKNRYYLVNGEKDEEDKDYHFCSITRNYEHMCGTEGKFFESKPVFWKKRLDS